MRIPSKMNAHVNIFGCASISQGMRIEKTDLTGTEPYSLNALQNDVISRMQSPKRPTAK